MRLSDSTTAVETKVPAAPEAEAVGQTEGLDFDAFRAGLDEPGWVRERREGAWRRFREIPLPTKKAEEWRYTDLKALALGSFSPLAPAAAHAEAEELPRSVREVLERSRSQAGVLVQRNGRVGHVELDGELTERGVLFMPLERAAREHADLLQRYLFVSRAAPMEEKLWTLHAAFLSGGYLLYVPRDVRVERPFHAFRVLERGGALAATHSLVVADSGAEATVVDEFVSPDLDQPSLSVAGAVIHGEANATLRYVALQRYGRGVKHFAIQHLSARRDTKLAGFNVTLGADLSRADVSSRLLGPGSESEMLALWFGDREQHFDHHTLQHHAAPHAHSDLLYKGALTEGASSVFRGLIRVDKGAQLTDAYQTNRNLLLSEDARATALPNLEIEADDVRCSHGATIGQVEAGQRFYLMSRGLTRKQAERLLVFGFLDEVLARLPVEGVRDRVREAIEEKVGV
ncbi:MAG: Fe-S cluster assembly protein SufD [Gemmatimonadota bacterium]